MRFFAENLKYKNQKELEEPIEESYSVFVNYFFGVSVSDLNSRRKEKELQIPKSF
jgi:hypothetical protein